MNIFSRFGLVTCLVALLGLVLVAGCGRKDDETSSGETPGEQGDEHIDPPGPSEIQVILKKFKDAMSDKTARRTDLAIAKFRKLADDYPTIALGKQSAYQVGCLLATTSGKEAEALKYLQLAQSSLTTDAKIDHAALLIATLKKKLVRRPVPPPGRDPKKMVFYRVQSGDTFTKISGKKKIPLACLFLANRHLSRLVQDPTKLGSTGYGRIVISNQRPNIVVDKSEFKLYVYYDDPKKPIFEYNIGIGKDGTESPAGVFKIVEKDENPKPIGTRNFGKFWMGFNDTDERDGYGIHGTNEPDSIGTKVSRGCIRMHNKDILYLERFIPIDTIVEIRE